MGHINFENIVRINKILAVWDITRITKPLQSVCNHYQYGKKTRVSFNSKEHSTSRPLELVHAYPCGLTRIKGLNGERYFSLLIDDFTGMTC